MKTTVLTCIDGSTYAPAVCDAAAWAALRLEAPLKFLHVLHNLSVYPNPVSPASCGLHG